MRSVLRQLLNDRARRLVTRRCELSVAPNAKVHYGGIVDRPSSRFSIGSGSIFQGRITADREGAEIHIGRDTFVGGSTFVCAERIEVGDDVLISWGCTIVDHNSHSTVSDERARDVNFYYLGEKYWHNIAIAPVRVANRAWIGFNSIILSGVTIGEGAIVGAGSVVTKDVDPFTIVAGNPARFIRQTI